MTGLRNVPGALRKTILYMPASLLGPLIQLATIVILTHWLRPAELGIYALAVAVQDLAQIATLSWWSQYVLRYLDETQPDRRAAQDRTEIAVLIMPPGANLHHCRSDGLHRAGRAGSAAARGRRARGAARVAPSGRPLERPGARASRSGSMRWRRSAAPA